MSDPIPPPECVAILADGPSDGNLYRWSKALRILEVRNLRGGWHVYKATDELDSLGRHILKHVASYDAHGERVQS